MRSGARRRQAARVRPSRVRLVYVGYVHASSTKGAGRSGTPGGAVTRPRATGRRQKDADSAGTAHEHPPLDLDGSFDKRELAASEHVGRFLNP